MEHTTQKLLHAQDAGPHLEGQAGNGIIVADEQPDRFGGFLNLKSPGKSKAAKEPEVRVAP